MWFTGPFDRPAAGAEIAIAHHHGDKALDPVREDQHRHLRPVACFDDVVARDAVNHFVGDRLGCFRNKQRLGLMNQSHTKWGFTLDALDSRRGLRLAPFGYEHRCWEQNTSQIQI